MQFVNMSHHRARWECESNPITARISVKFGMADRTHLPESGTVNAPALNKRRAMKDIDIFSGCVTTYTKMTALLKYVDHRGQRSLSASGSQARSTRPNRSFRTQILM
jgi:hypothetical protein